MPRVQIYIRNEDWEKWKSIDDVPEWLHERLNNIVFKDKEYVITTKESEES